MVVNQERPSASQQVEAIWLWVAQWKNGGESLLWSDVPGPHGTVRNMPLMAANKDAAMEFARVATDLGEEMKDRIHGVMLRELKA